MCWSRLLPDLQSMDLGGAPELVYKARQKTEMVAKWCRINSSGVMTMSTTVTVKNIPDDIYDSLKRVANAQHRSINSEVIACLERAMRPSRISNEELVERARQIRGSLEGQQFAADDIQRAIDAGRP